MDFEGPVPLDDDEDAVTVEELTEMLTDPQKDALREQLTTLDSHSFSQLDMLRQYTVAKSYVYDYTNN